MIQKVALLHTVVFLADMFDGLFRKHLPGLDHFHLVDEGILRELMARGGLTTGVTRRIAIQASLAQQAGADLILFTCSSTSPSVDVVRQITDVPILKIDEPMARKAVGMGKRIGVVASAETTLRPSISLIESIAAEKQCKIKVESVFEADAFQARLDGDMDKHDGLVRKAAIHLAAGNDVIILAQASMAHLEQSLSRELAIPVLSGPSVCMETMAQMHNNPI